MAEISIAGYSKESMMQDVGKLKKSLPDLADKELQGLVVAIIRFASEDKRKDALHVIGNIKKKLAKKYDIILN